MSSYICSRHRESERLIGEMSLWMQHVDVVNYAYPSFLDNRFVDKPLCFVGGDEVRFTLCFITNSRLTSKRFRSLS